MRNRTLATVLLVAISPCAAGAVEITLDNPSLETAVYNYGTPANAVNIDTNGIGWFSDWAASQAKGAVAVTGTFWHLDNADGPNAGFVSQLNDTYGASLFQTVFLEADIEYTLTAAAGTGVHATDPINKLGKNDAKFALAFVTAPITGFDAGGYPVTILAEMNGVIPDRTGLFVDYSVSYIPPTSGYYNIALQNRGYVPNTGANNNQSTVFFDNVRLTYSSEPELLGDINGDGIVGSADLDIVRGNWGQSVSGAGQGDANGDGTVGSADLDIVRADWGLGNPAAVPEPGILVLLGMAVACTGFRRASWIR